MALVTGPFATWTSTPAAAIATPTRTMPAQTVYNLRTIDSCFCRKARISD